MIAVEYYRGGSNLTPKPRDVRIDRATGMLDSRRGVSVYDRSDNLDRFGGAHRVTNVPSSLKVVQRGRDPHHYEIVPATPMTLDEYEEALATIVLVPV